MKYMFLVASIIWRYIVCVTDISSMSSTITVYSDISLINKIYFS